MGCGNSKESASQQPSLIRNETRRTGPSTYKVVLLGDKAVGKSSLVLRYTQDKFSEHHELTIGAAFVSKDVKLDAPGRPPAQLRLHIWDTAGEEAYRSMTRFFYREAAAGVVVFDLTSASSFAAVTSWIRDFQEQCPDAIVVVAGNKADCPDRAVTTLQAQQFARSNGMLYVECSAKENRGVTELFETAGRELVKSSP